MRKISYVALALALLPAAALATDWVKIGGSPTGVTVYYDRDNATYGQGQVYAWVRVVYPAPEALSGGETASELRTHYVIDCMARTIGTTGVEFYNAGGTLVRTIVPDSKVEAINMQTPGGAVGKLFCQNW